MLTTKGIRRKNVLIRLKDGSSVVAKINLTFDDLQLLDSPNLLNIPLSRNKKSFSSAHKKRWGYSAGKDKSQK
jgi:hypothetical protein